MKNNPETARKNNLKWRLANKEHIKEYRKRPDIRKKEIMWCREYKSSLKGRFSKLKTNAKQRGIAVSITFEEYKNIVSQKCYLCGGETLCLKSGHGVDRVNNEIGYKIENCKACCGVCNKMKMDSSLEDFILRVKKIFKNYENS